MVENKVKIQHYVPRFYLKRFANADGENYIIECFDKINEKHFNTDVMNIACEHLFYDTEEDFDQKTEKNLARIEGIFNESLSNLIRYKDVSKISVKDRYVLSLFIAVQYIRTKEKREMLKDSINQLAEKLSKEKLSPKLGKEIKEAQTKESIKKMHVGLLKDTPELAEIIFQMKWILIINGTQTPFWTSDNPVALHNEVNHGPRGNLGLKCIGIELHLPLTPRLLLLICDPIVFSKEPAKKMLRDFRYIIREQSYQIYSSTRFVFSDKPHFYFAKKVVNENPRHKDPNRKRVAIS